MARLGDEVTADNARAAAELRITHKEITRDGSAPTKRWSIEEPVDGMSPNTRATVEAALALQRDVLPDAARGSRAIAPGSMTGSTNAAALA